MKVDLERFERLITPVPGPRSIELQAQLARYEVRGLTYLGPSYPVFWAAASGALVTDVDANRYLDLSAAFGVANVGHANPSVAQAIAQQASVLIHGMGDVHPTAIRVQLLERIAALAPGNLTQTYLTNGGAEAVEFALKTALLATRRAHVLAYRGAYHGLSLGTLPVMGIEKFRAPFARLTAPSATWLDFPHAADAPHEAVAAARRALDDDPQIGAIILEPIQGRGGVLIPPPGFLAGLRTLCDEREVVLIFDEIYTGFGRTGYLFACNREGVVPDLLCVGKALAGGVPIGATIGSKRVMDAWPASSGEALHTSTFLGNPLACAAALATLAELDRLDLVAQTHRGEAAFAAALEPLRAHEAVVDLRGVGYLWALEFRSAPIANRIVLDALARGVIVLQSGPTGTSVTLAPPLTIGPDQLERALAILSQGIAAVSAR